MVQTLQLFAHPICLFSTLFSMYLPPVVNSLVLASLLGISSTSMMGQALPEQDRGHQPTDACPAQPHTLGAMRNCYRPLLVFAPAMDNPQLVQQFNQLKTQPDELKRRNMLYVPIVPEGHNQPVPSSKVPTARLSEDELAALRHRFNVEPEEFLVILIGKDGGQKLDSRTPVGIEQLKRLIDSMPMRKSEKKQEPQGEQ